MKKIVGGIFTLACLTLLLGFGIRTSIPETATWNGDAWECPTDEPLIYFDGQHTADNATYEQAQRAKSSQVWCEKDESLLTFFLELLWSRAKNRFQRHAEKRSEAVRQAIEDAQAAETKRVLSKCYALPDQEMVPDHPLGRLREACVSLVLDQRIVKPTDFCHQLASAENFDSCVSGFKTDDATAACALMVRDPDLAPACKGVERLPENGSSESNHLRQNP